MLNQKIIIQNKLGLHARACARWVSCALKFKSDLHVIKNNKKINGKNIMELMLLAAHQGTELELIISGEDEQAMMNELTQLIKDRFGEI